MSFCRMILADDHTLLRQGLIKILSERTDFEVIGDAGDGIELLALLKKFNPDMVILDISMPNLRGLEAIHEIKVIYPRIKILVLTMHKDEEYLFQAISAGAEGYLLKEEADKELFSAIDKLMLGKIFISARLFDTLPGDRSNICGKKQKPYPEFKPLTVREKEILKLVAEGKSSKDISGLFFISVRTVEHHRANIMAKLNLKKTADFVRYAVCKGYI